MQLSRMSALVAIAAGTILLLGCGSGREVELKPMDQGSEQSAGANQQPESVQQVQNMQMQYREAMRKTAEERKSGGGGQ